MCGVSHLHRTARAVLSSRAGPRSPSASCGCCVHSDSTHHAAHRHEMGRSVDTRTSASARCIVEAMTGSHASGSTEAEAGGAGYLPSAWQHDRSNRSESERQAQFLEPWAFGWKSRPNGDMWLTASVLVAVVARCPLQCNPTRPARTRPTAPPSHTKLAQSRTRLIVAPSEPRSRFAAS